MAFAVGNSFIGLSTDTKPANPQAGWCFLETDTGNDFIVVNTVWTRRMTREIAPTVSEVLNAGYSNVVVRCYKIASGNTLLLQTGARLRIL